LQIWLFTTGNLVLAQNLPGRWVDDLYLITFHHPAKESYRQCLVDEKNNIHKEIPHITESLDLTVPNDFFKYNTMEPKWYNGALYTQAHRWGDKEKDGEKYCYEHFAKFEDDKWNYLGEFKTKPGNRIDIIPCANNRFIVISDEIDLTNDNRPDRTPFARASFSSGSKELRIDSPIDHGQDELRKYRELHT